MNVTTLSDPTTDELAWAHSVFARPADVDDATCLRAARIYERQTSRPDLREKGKLLREIIEREGT